MACQMPVSIRSNSSLWLDKAQTISLHIANNINEFQLPWCLVLRKTASTNVRQQEIVTIRNRLSRLVVSWLAALDARLLLLRLNEELIDEPCSVPWVSKCFIRICDTETKRDQRNSIHQQKWRSQGTTALYLVFKVNTNFFKRHLFSPRKYTK